MLNSRQTTLYYNAAFGRVFGRTPPGAGENLIKSLNTTVTTTVKLTNVLVMPRASVTRWQAFINAGTVNNNNNNNNNHDAERGEEVVRFLYYKRFLEENNNTSYATGSSPLRSDRNTCAARVAMIWSPSRNNHPPSVPAFFPTRLFYSIFFFFPNACFICKYIIRWFRLSFLSLRVFARPDASTNYTPFYTRHHNIINNTRLNGSLALRGRWRGYGGIDRLFPLPRAAAARVRFQHGRKLRAARYQCPTIAIIDRFVSNSPQSINEKKIIINVRTP